ncbi:hypothetical protein MTO96_010264 [Rhipicephalus appendiculatus]
MPVVVCDRLLNEGSRKVVPLVCSITRTFTPRPQPSPKLIPQWLRLLAQVNTGDETAAGRDVSTALLFFARPNALAYRTGEPLRRAFLPLRSVFA